MIRRYDLGKRCIAYLLLVSLLLQSCYNSNNNSPRPSEEFSPKQGEEQERDRFLLAEGDFNKEEKIGSGSYGNVFRCRLNNHGLYALKEIELKSDTAKERDENIADVNSELKTLKSLNHENIIHLIGYYVPPTKDKLMIVMDLYNMSLERYLKKQKEGDRWFQGDNNNKILLTPVDLKKVAKHTLEGLNYLHTRTDKPIAHMDIKPSNILVRLNKHREISLLLLTDFGISKHVENTITTTIKGTPHYMAPELTDAYFTHHQTKGRFKLLKTDVYSFGKVLYNCVTCEPPIPPIGGVLKMPTVADTHQETDKQAYGIIVNMFEESIKTSPEERPTCSDLLAILNGNQSRRISTNMFEQPSLAKQDVNSNSVSVSTQNNPARISLSNFKVSEQAPEKQVVNSNEPKQKWTSSLKSYISPWKLLAVFVGIIAIFFASTVSASIQNKVQSQLCDMHYNGNFFIPQNHTQARDCYEKYADQWEYTSGPINLCHIYVNEHGEKNYKAAAKWCKKAAEQGHPFAQGRLGYMYQHGYGVTQDHKSAMEWAQKAADQGDSWAQETLGWLYSNGQGVVANHQKASEWFQKAADQGNALAQHSLGSVYRYAIQNHNKAIEWYQKALEKLQKAADQGDEHAQHRLGVMYDNGQGVVVDHKKAAEWYQKAADQGNQWSQHDLGCMYQDGRLGVEKNRQRAIELFRRSAAQGNQAAKVRLRELGTN